MRRIILLILFLFISNSIYASKISDFFTRDSQEKRNTKASEFLETLLNDGTLIQAAETENFTSIIGSTADMVLISIKNSITPSIVNLTKTDNKKTISIKRNSFIGNLIYLLIIIECLVLSLENFISDGINAKKIVARIIHIIFIIAFISFLPIISDSILNIFSSIGLILSGNTNFTPPSSQHPFTYMPSDCLYTLNICKKMLSVEHIRIGGYELSTIIPHFIVSLGEFAISIPFIILMLIIVFWYCEMFLIFISGCLVLPFTIFSKSSITDYKNILKAMLGQGVKISVGIFLSTFIKDIIISSLKMINSSFTSTTHAVIFTIFITFIIFFVITKGSGIILSALNANFDTKSPLSFSQGLLAGGALALGKSLSNISKISNNTKSSPLTIPDKKEISINKKESPSYRDSETQIIKPKSNKNNKVQNKDKYGEVSAIATKDRINAARTELLNEGITNPSEDDVIKKAKNDAIISKLIKIEKKGFILDDGRYNKPAAEQLKRLRKTND